MTWLSFFGLFKDMWLFGWRWLDGTGELEMDSYFVQISLDWAKKALGD